MRIIFSEMNVVEKTKTKANTEKGPTCAWMIGRTFKDFKDFQGLLRTFKGCQRLPRTFKDFQRLRGFSSTLKDFQELSRISKDF